MVNDPSVTVLAEASKCETSSLHVQQKVFHRQKEREPPSLVKLTRQEKIKKYTIVVTTY